MPESLLARRLKLGKFLGIGLYVHWSFALLILYVVLSTRGEGAAVMAFAVTQLFGVFLCVTLHEYGHAMAARVFGIGTADITLLPIGGVARLQRMPRIPWQELVVAVAGPAVNVVIATLLVLGFVLFVDPADIKALTSAFSAGVADAPIDDESMVRANDIMSSPSVLGFALLMLIINVMLVLFNMIPAFPMDGGRVFRSLMAMAVDYRRATWIASRVGLVCAFLMAFAALGLDPSNPIPVLIAVFIGYAGMAEARQVDVMESVRGLTVGQVMVRSNVALPMDTPLGDVLAYWRNIGAPAIPVISLVGTVVGMLTLSDLSSAVDEGADPSTTAGQLVDHDSTSGTVRASESLESVLMRLGRKHRQIPVVDDEGYLVGILDLDSMLARRFLSRNESVNEVAAPAHFDQTL